MVFTTHNERNRVVSCQLTLSLHLNLGASLFAVKTHRRNAISQLQAHWDPIAPSIRHSSGRRAECVFARGNESRGQNKQPFQVTGAHTKRTWTKLHSCSCSSFQPVPRLKRWTMAWRWHPPWAGCTGRGSCVISTVTQTLITASGKRLTPRDSELSDLLVSRNTRSIRGGAGCRFPRSSARGVSSPPPHFYTNIWNQLKVAEHIWNGSKSVTCPPLIRKCQQTENVSTEEISYKKIMTNPISTAK